LTFRKKGLNSKLDKNKLIIILYWYINHRGFKYEVAGEKVEKEILKNKDFLPVENQIKYFKTKGYLNGTFNRSIHSDEYVKEIKAIFKNQGLSSKFEERFIELFKRQRSFEQGPGNEKARTRYGRFYELKDNELVKKEKPAESI
jgi:CRISPR-associated endonuclease Csn1